MDLSSIDINKLVDLGGTVVIAVIFILYNYQKDKMYNKVISNHISHATDATKDLTVAIEKLIQKLD